MTDLTPETEALGGDGSRPAGDTAATDATPPAAFLARAWEWLGCEMATQGEDVDGTTVRICVDHDWFDWPCSEATRLAALLADVAASAWDEGAMHGEVCEGALRYAIRDARAES